MPEQENRFAPYHPGLLAFTLKNTEGISLEDSIRAIQGKGRKVRALVGPESIMERTLGLADIPKSGIHISEQVTFKPYDTRRTYVEGGKEASTEFAEALDALAACELRPTVETAVAGLLEVGDVLYQQGVLRLSHASHEHQVWADEQMSRAIGFLTAKLGGVKLSILDAERLTVVKYAVRGIVLNTDKERHGMPNKDKLLEDALCRYALEQVYGDRFKPA